MNPIVLEKVDQAVAILQEKKIDLWLTFVRETSVLADPMLPLIYGETGLTWHSALILTRQGQRIAIVGRLEREAAQSTGAYTQVLTYDQSIQPVLLDTLEHLNPQQIAINTCPDDELADGLTHGMYSLLTHMLANTPYLDRLISSPEVIAALNGRKTAQEVQRIQTAVDIAEEIFTSLFADLRPGLTEREVAARMHAEVDRRGLETAWARAGCPAVNHGPLSAVGHGLPGDIPLEPGHILHLDFGVRYQGYCSDLQRVVYMLRPGETQPPEAVQHGFRTVADTVQAVAQAMLPGTPGHELDQLARQRLTAAGYPEFPYGLGHQVGRRVHDGGALMGPLWERYGRRPLGTLEAGQVFTIEPGLMIPEHGYVGLEEDVIVTPQGARFLSRPQTEWIVR